MGLASKLGEGSVFHFILPAHKSSQINTVVGSSPAVVPQLLVSLPVLQDKDSGTGGAEENLLQRDVGASTGLVRVLFAEDDHFCNDVGVVMLEKVGCSVETFFNGQQVVNRFVELKGAVDLVVLDV